MRHSTIDRDDFGSTKCLDGFFASTRGDRLRVECRVNCQDDDRGLEVAYMGNCNIAEINGDAFSFYPRLARVETYCRGHHAEDVTLEQAAQVAALERTYFSEYFHSKVGVCFTCWFTSLRIEDAKMRLASSSTPISEVAYDVGYQSLGSFERAFKRCTGVTAREFRKRSSPV